MTCDFPTNPGDMTADWLAQALGASAGELTAFDAAKVGTGQMCDSFRLTLDWAADAAHGLPRSIIAKCPSHDPASRAIAAAVNAYALEFNFYRELAANIAVPTPKCHFAAIAGDGQDFLLLLADLSPARAGDQLAGGDMAMLQAAIAAAAPLHAAYWGDAALEDKAWLARDNRDLLRHHFPPMFAAFRERYAGRLDADCIAVGEGLVARIEPYLSRQASVRTLVHGDLRIDNILFAPDKAQCWLVDWQTLGVGSAAADIAYLIGTSQAAYDAVAERVLFDQWLAALAAHGVTPDAETLWREYRIGALSGYFMAVFASMSVERTPRGDAMFAVMAQRPARQALALHSLELLH